MEKNVRFVKERTLVKNSFCLLQLNVLPEFIIDECPNHSPIGFFDNRFGKPCFNGLSTNLIDYLLDAVWCTDSCVVGFESCCSFNTFATLCDYPDQLTVNFIDSVSDVFN
ncbi:Uncharacterised protein [Klebsiella pneumoniae]|nr:Uncharacterised protein [Klebsiella pneumoniae]